MDTETLRFIMRAAGTAREIQASARQATGHSQAGHVGTRLAMLTSEVGEALQRGAPELVDEFKRIADVTRENGEVFWRDVEPGAAALVGWLDGTIASETFSAKLEAEARAYAEARVASERPTGFAAPPADE